MSEVINVSRRNFLRATAATGAGLTLGFNLSSPARAYVGAAPAVAFEPNAFVRIGADNSVTVISKHLEMGQGTYTGLATILAEELDADWGQIAVEGAPADASRYNNLFWGPAQGTGGSTAMANSWEQLRKAGATARAMLVQAAADRWGVPAGEITVHKGVVSHRGSNREATFGNLAVAAAALPAPEAVRLKDPRDFVYIGKHVPRTDSPAKSDGSAIYTQDIKLEGMLTALVAHPPRFGATAASFDASSATSIKGVEAVVRIPSGVAVLARDFWSAKRGRDALVVDWDDSRGFKLGSEEIMDRYKTLAREPGAVARAQGDAEQALAGAATTLEASFELPYLAHAAMEPMNCVIRKTDAGCEVWNGEQLHTGDQFALAEVFGIQPEQVKINMLYAGGSFGRRANPVSDYVLETAHIVKAIGGKAPVKLVWTREDDTRAGFFRPMYYHVLKAGLDNDGRLVGWHHRIVGQSILKGTPFEAMLVKDGIDKTSVEGAANLPYAVPNLQVELHTTDIPVPVQWWRAVGSTHTAFSTETFIDELALAANADPVAFRRALLREHPRHLATLDLAVANSDWGKPMAAGKGRGIAVHESFNSVVAQIAEVSVSPDGGLEVDKVVCAVDCGIAINPDVIKAQMEGGIGYGLTATLHGAITLDGGRVQQSNFHDYVPLRINEMPEIEVHIVESSAAPTGVGEPGTPVIAPAVANAVAAATGRRLRTLPLSLGTTT